MERSDCPNRETKLGRFRRIAVQNLNLRRFSKKQVSVAKFHYLFGWLGEFGFFAEYFACRLIFLIMAFNFLLKM
jgi:hypothetical protein